MSFALATVLLFIIIIPGLVARFCYFTFPFSNQARQVDLITEIFWSIVPGFTIQFIYLIIVENITKYYVNFPYTGALINGIKEENISLVSAVMNNIHKNIFEIIEYNIILLIIAALIGFFFKFIVRSLRLDIRFNFFRFNNKWFYILSGEILDIERGGTTSREITVIGIDILCKVGNDNILYIGELANYYLNSTGDLDALLVRYPMRRKFLDDKLETDPYYNIPSDYLYIPYRDIVNLNINYFELDV